MAAPSASGPELGGPALSPRQTNGAVHAPSSMTPSPSGANDGRPAPPLSLPPSATAPTTTTTTTTATPAKEGSSGSLPGLSASKSVKRPRPVKSCTECRKRKLKCDRILPCGQCQKSHRSCKYAADQDPSALSDGSDVESGDTSRPTKRNCVPIVNAPNTAGEPGGAGIPIHLNGDSQGHTPATLADLDSRVTRVEQTLAKSPVASELAGPSLRLHVHPEMIRGLTVKAGAERTRFFGQSSVRVLVNLFDEAKDFLAHEAKLEEFRDLMSILSRLHRSILTDHKRQLTPLSVYVASATPVLGRVKHVLSALPGRQVCDRLLGSYISTTETIYRIIHFPTFMRQYGLYWEGHPCNDTFLIQLMLILAAGSRFESASKGLDPNLIDGLHIPTACELARSWLNGLKGKQLVDFTTLQTAVVLIQAQRMITTNSHDLWVQLGSVVRMAQTMGLQRDPSEFDAQIPVFMAEMRRRLWFTIVELDLHVSLLSNLPTIVRADESTCDKPRNLDDADLDPSMTTLPPGKTTDQYTDNQIQVCAANTLNLRLKVIHLVARIESVRDYRDVLQLGAKLESCAEDVSILFPRDNTLNDSQKSKHWRCRVVLDMHVRRPLLALYRPFALGATNAPPQISQAYLRSSLIILQYLDELDPRLAHYQNVSDMYHHVLKKDMLQASLSVCYYIRQSVQPHAAGSGSNGNSLSPLSLGAPGVPEDESPIASSAPRLIRTVEKSMELLMRNVGGSDVKDIIALAIVFASVRTPAREHRVSEIKRSLLTVRDTCMHATKTTPEKLATIPPLAGDVMNPYIQGGFNYHYQPAAPVNPAEGDAVWDLENWEHIDSPGAA